MNQLFPFLHNLFKRRPYWGGRYSCFFLICFEAVLLLITPVSDLAAQGGDPAESPWAGEDELALMAAEAPLNQADLDVVIELANAPDDEDQEILSASGLSPLRLNLVLTKISFGMLILAGLQGDDRGDIPAVLLPSREELDLIAANLEKMAGAVQNDERPVEERASGGNI